MGDKGCLMAFVPPDQAEDILAFGHSIPDDELAKDGRENECHVTVLFGFTRAEPENIAKLLEGSGDLRFTLGKTSLFENPEEGDVLKIDVEGSEIHEMHHLLACTFDYVSDYPDYKPHLTVAHLKPGEGAKYAGDTRFLGRSVTASRLIFSSPSKEKTVIYLDDEPVNADAVLDRLLAG